MKKIFILLLLFCGGEELFAQETKDLEKKIVLSCSQKDKLIIQIKDLTNLRFENNFNKKINHFKLKIPGEPTFSIEGNKLKSLHIDSIKRLKEGESILIFSAKPCGEDSFSSKPLKISFVK